MLSFEIGNLRRFKLQGGELLRGDTLAFLFGKLCFLLTIVFALFFGSAVREFISFSLPEVVIEDGEGDAGSRQRIELAAYNSIAERNIFNLKAAPVANVPVANTQQLKIRLVGTTVGKQSRSAILEDLNKNEQDVFSEKETAFGRAMLVDIKAESVKIQYNGKIETLLLEEGATGGSGVTERDAPADDGETSFTVSEQEISEALNNLPLLLSQARAVPYFRNGQSIGMRLFAIRRDSLYEKLGLKNGDILTNINDNSLSDPSQALKIFEQLKSERRIGVKLERNGEAKDFDYSIR